MNPEVPDTQVANSVGTEVNLGGRPTKYSVKFNKLVYKFALLGATDKQMAEFLEVTEETFRVWKLQHPGFSGAIRKGKLKADAQVAKSLYHRACGYSHKAVKIFQHEGQTFEHEYIERYPPDTAAAIIWLKNRRPDVWRDRMEVSSILKVDPNSLSDQQLAVLAEHFLKDIVGNDPKQLEQARKELESGNVVINATSERVEDEPASTLSNESIGERKTEDWEP